SGPVTLSMSPDGRYLAIGNPNVPSPAAYSPTKGYTQSVTVYRNGRALTQVREWHQSGTPIWDGDHLLLAGFGPTGRIQVADASGRVVGSWSLGSARDL